MCGPAALPAGGVISYVGSSGASPNRTSPVSLCSDSSNGSSQSGSQPFPTYFPPSPTGSLQDSRAYGGGSLAPPGPRDERRRSSPSKAGSTVTRLLPPQHPAEHPVQEVPQERELLHRPHQPQPLPAVPLQEVPAGRHVPRR
ncbi:unnamed protein product [Bubo scandiacus]